MPPNTTAASKVAVECMGAAMVVGSSPPSSVSAAAVNGSVNGVAKGSFSGIANGAVNGSVNGVVNSAVNNSVKGAANDVATKAVWVDKYNYTGHEIIWLNTIAIIIFHVLTVILFFAAFSHTGWKTGVWACLLGVAGGFGVTGGVHRLWTHRSYKAKWPLRLLLMLCFCVSGQNSIFDWVRDHRVHHKFSETDADPHNVKRGFFFAHVGWLMLRKHPEVRRLGQQVDMSDILRDPIAAFQIKYHTPMKLLMCFIIPIGVPIYFWGEHWFPSLAMCGMTRYMLNLNFTWLVNSAAHMFGNKPYDRRIAPVENAAVSLVALGEGWHNYHHVFPWDYKAAELAHINWTMHMLDWFARIGWAYDLKSAPASLVERVAKRWGDGSHDQWGAVPEIPEEAAQDPSIVDALPAPEPVKDKAA